MDYEKDQIQYVKSTSSTIICKNFVKIDQREVPQKVLQAVFKNDRARSFFTCTVRVVSYKMFLSKIFPKCV